MPQIVVASICTGDAFADVLAVGEQLDLARPFQGGARFDTAVSSIRLFVALGEPPRNVRTARVQIKYATQQLGYPVWGMSPSSTPDDSGGYGGFGVEGLAFPYYGFGADASHPNEGLSQCHGCATEDVVTPFGIPWAGVACPALRLRG